MTIYIVVFELSNQVDSAWTNETMARARVMVLKSYGLTAKLIELEDGVPAKRSGS